MKYLIKIVIFIEIFFLSGCQFFEEPVIESQSGYEIPKGISLTVLLQNPLSSNTNQRGDPFITLLKEPLKFNKKIILPKNTQIRGLVKRTSLFEKIGDQANLLLLFDQIVLPDNKKIPIVASLDTKEGDKVITIPGKKLKDTAVIVGFGVVGALVNQETSDKDGTAGFLIGAGAGTGAVMLSNIKEVKLPVGTELMIKLDEKIIIPK